MKRIFQKLGSIYLSDNSNIFCFRKWGFFMAATILAATSAKAAYLAFDLPQQYSELIVGDIAWFFSNKFHDYATLFCFVAGFFIFLTAISALSNRLAKKVGGDAEDRFHEFLALLSTPAGVWFAGLLTMKNSSLRLLGLSGILLLVALIFIFLLTQKSNSFELGDASLIFRVLQKIFLVLFATGFAVAAIGVCINRIAALLNTDFWLNIRNVYRLGFISVFLIVVAVVAFIFKSRSLNHLEQLLKRSILLLQLFFPLLFLLLVPTPWLVNNKSVVMGYPLSSIAWLVICLCVITAYIDLFRRYKLSESFSNTNSLELFSSLCVIGVLLFLKATPVPIPSISADDYHFGEMLVPWWSLTQQGMVPFWDYSPVRGLMNYFPGAVDSIFFDGKASSFAAVSPFIYAAILFIALPALRWSIGIGVATLALLFMPYLNGVSEIDIIVTVFICMLSHGSLKWKPPIWVAVWLFLDTAIILYAPGQGALAIFAISPIAIFMLYRAYMDERKAFLNISLAFTVAILIIGLTPLGKMIFGALRYGIEQSGVNSIAHGTIWILGSPPFAETNPWLFEIMRASWLLVALWAGVLILKMLSSQFAAERQAVLAYAIPILILMMLFIIRAAGRIGIGERPKYASIWALSLLLPLLLFTAAKIKSIGSTIFIWLSVAGMVYPHFGGFVTNFLHIYEPVPVSSVDLVRGSSVGIPELGLATMEASHLARLTAIRKVLDRVLDPQETYLDLTGRHAAYFYFNRRPPIETGSTYNLVTESQQLRAIASLQKEYPPAILISADNITHDGGPVSLRSNLLYRYVLLEPGYKVVDIAGYVWLIRSDRIERISGMDVRSISDINDESSNIIHGIFRQENLLSIPASWGRSFATLESKMRLVQEVSKDVPITLNSIVQLGNGYYRVIGDDPFVRFDISDMQLRGRDAGIMSFDFSCESVGAHPAPGIAIYWASSSNPESEITSVILQGRKGPLIVPMDAAPAWLLATHILSVRFDIRNQGHCSEFKVKNIRFFQRQSARSPL